jgi:ATP-dependent RNA helicase DDX5/DBP2
MAALGANLHAPTWETVKLQTFEKNFYREHPDVAARPSSEVEEYRRKHHMNVVGTDVPKPVTSFDEAGFPGGFSIFWKA